MAEGAGVVQLGEEKPPGRPYSGLQYVKEAYRKAVKGFYDM